MAADPLHRIKSPETSAVGPQTGKREVGYWLGRFFSGWGVATAALTAFLRLEPTRPLYASAAQHNAASLGVLQKCGFTISGSADEMSEGSDTPRVHLTLTTAMP